MLQVRKAVAAGLAITVIAAAASSCSDDNADSGSVSTVTIAASTGGPFAQNLNPVAPNSGLQDSRSFVYEPLLQFNKLKPDEILPWLASEYQWDEEGTTLTFTIRDGVTWNDGEEFTNQDVAFTYNYVKDHPEINSNGLAITSVEAPDDSTVVLTFDTPQFANLYYIATQLMLPQHVWEEVSDPATAENLEPVGTGPYKVSKFTPQQITFAKNDEYWQEGKPQIEQVIFPSSTDNNGPGLALIQGKANWGGVFFPGVKEFEAKSEFNHYWFPPMSNTVLILNLEKAPMNDLALRQAMNLALDRKAVSDASTLGLVPVVENPTMLTPFQEDFLNPKYQDAELTQDVDEARKILTDAGYTYSGDSLVAPDGKPVELTLPNPGPLSDLVASGQEVAKQLAAIGIDVQAQSVSVAEWDSAQSTGQYDIAVRPSPAGPSPYFMYNYWLNSDLTAPTGEAASGNFSRWRDDETDSLLTQYASTDDPDAQQEAMYGLQEIVVEQLPVLPLQYQAFWGEYNDEDIVGWPSEEDPYALASFYDRPSNVMVLLNLRPREE